MTLWQIYLSFAKIGALTFGGGYAMLPMIQKEIIERRGWVTDQDVVDYYAVGQCLPGVIAANSALFIGNKIRGWRGGLAAVLGVVTPSVIIITLLAAFMRNFFDNETVQAAFYGIRIVVCALIVQAVVKLWKTAIKDIFGICVYVAVLFAALAFGAEAAFLSAAALISGIIADIIRRKGSKEAAT